MSEYVEMMLIFKNFPFPMSNANPLHTKTTHSGDYYSIAYDVYKNRETFQIVSHFIMKFRAHKIPIFESVCDSVETDSETVHSDSTTSETWVPSENEDDPYESSFIDDSVCTSDSISTSEKSNTSAEVSSSTDVRQEQDTCKLPKDILKKILESDSVRSNETF